MGWLAIDNFLGDTRGAVDSLRVGEVSRVAAVEGGFHLFKLIGEQAESEYSFEEIKDELRGMVEREERQKRLETYLKELREPSFVEVRADGQLRPRRVRIDLVLHCTLPLQDPEPGEPRVRRGAGLAQRRERPLLRRSVRPGDRIRWHGSPRAASSGRSRSSRFPPAQLSRSDCARVCP